MTIYIYLLEISNYKEEYQNFVEQNSKRIFDEKVTYFIRGIRLCDS